MTTICSLIMVLLWLSIIVVRVLFNKEFSAPIGRREMRYTTGEWAGWFVFASFLLFFSLLFSVYLTLPFWIILIGAMIGFVIAEFNVINWRIVYTDTEFIFRNTFRFVSKYSYEEILDIHILQHPVKHYHKRMPPEKLNVEVHMQMPDKVIRFESRRNDGKFLSLLLRKTKGLK